MAGDGELPSQALIYGHPWILLSVLEQLYNSDYNTCYNHSDINAKSFSICSICTISDSIVPKICWHGIWPDGCEAFGLRLRA